MEGSWWAIPYGAVSSSPVWGTPTSAVNFCEEDYVITRYVAEFFNTLTSLMYIGYGYHGIRRFKNRNVNPFASVNWPYWGLIGVGIFSGLYHSTLKYHTQMSDELSMHVAIGTVMVQVFTFQEPPAIQRRNTLVILAVLVPFFIYHCLADEFILHVIIFLGMCVIVTWKTRLIIRTRIRDDSHREKMKALATFGSCAALLGYFLWNIDVNFCSLLTHWKRKVGMPWGIFLELHGYWHILTAIGAYAFMAMIEFLTLPEHGETRGIGFAWPAKVVLEGIAPNMSPGRSTNGYVDGSPKKKIH